jgi:hypothetical protein
VADEAIFKYDKPGARVTIFGNRLELTTGMLWAKRTHTVLLRSITAVSVIGAGGHTLRVQTAGGHYDVEVGIGAASKLRQRILDLL